jgi:hypothetical protein
VNLTCTPSNNNTPKPQNPKTPKPHFALMKRDVYIIYNKNR